jgi:hypothetical protein
MVRKPLREEQKTFARLELFSFWPVHVECISGTTLSSNSNPDQPVGQISGAGDLPVQPHIQKYFRSRLTHSPRRPVPHEGRIAIVTDVGRDAVDAGGAKRRGRFSRTEKSCGSDAPKLASSLREEAQATVSNKPGRRGEHEGNR